MLNNCTVEDIIGDLCSEDLDNTTSAIWFITNNFYKFNNDERQKILFSLYNFIDNNRLKEQTITWIIGLVNSIGYYLEPNDREIAIRVFNDALKSKDSSIVSYALETVARMNYILTKSQIDDLLEPIINIENKFEEFPLRQNLIICCCSLIHYCSEEKVSKLEALIDTVASKTGLINIYKKSPALSASEVVFYVPDFLSGKSFLQPPSGELSSAAVLKQNGVSASIIDNRIYHMNMDNVIEILRKIKPKFVAVTTTPYDQVSIYYCDYRLSRILYDVKRLKEEGFTVVLCGSHGTIKPEDMLKRTGADTAVLGEWDLTINELYKVLKEDIFNYNKLLNVPNIVINNLGEITFTHEDMDMKYPEVEKLPMPDYSLIDITAYYGDEYINNEHIIRPSWASLLVQRGCPFNCGFCYNFFGRKVRSRTPYQVADELQILQDQYNIEHVFFIDYTFTADRKWVSELCKEIISRGLTIKWNCETRVDCIDNDTLKLMRQANCHRIWLGVETFSDSLLSSCNKQITEARIVDGIKLITGNGIRVSCFLMIGLPGETLDTVNHTLKRIKEIGVEYTKSIIVVIPRAGTQLFERASKYMSDASFEEMNALKGLVDNEISENDIINTIDIMSKRNTKEWFINDRSERVYSSTEQR